MVRFLLLTLRFAVVGLLGLLAALPSRAEPWQRDPILSQILIRQLLTDPVGYQWIATDEGVFRYDGYELVPLTRFTRPGSVAVPKGVVAALCLDPTDRLWIGADAGLFCLTLRTGVFRRVALRPGANAPQPTITSLFRHPRSGQLWVSCSDGSAVVLDAARGGRVLSRRYLPGVGFRFQPDGSAAGVWLSFAEMRYFDPVEQRERLGLPGIAQFGPTGPARHYLPTNGVVMAVPGTSPQQFFSSNALYELTANNQLRAVRRWLADDRSDNFLPAALGPDTAYEWGSNRHLVQLTVRGPRAVTVTLDSLRLDENPSSYRHKFIVYRDGLGVQWCYSREWRGVYKRRVAAAPTVRALKQVGGLPLPSARGIAQLADGRLVVGTYDGAYAQAADSPRAPLRRLRVPDWRPTPTDRVKASTTRRLVLLPTFYDLLTTHVRPATTVVAEEDIGFSVFDPAVRECRRLPLAAGERHHPVRFLTLFEHPRGRVWGGTDSGLFVLDLRRQCVRRYQPRGAAAAETLRRRCILDLAADSATGHLWLSTQQGLYRLQPATGELRRVGAPGTLHPLPTDDLLCVAAAGPGRAWVGTRVDGLLLVDAQRGLLRQLSVANGLPSSTVATVLVRPDGTVWAGTYAGLIRYDPAQQRLAVFGPSAGLTEAEMNRNSAYADPRTGALLFGGVGGAFEVAPTTMGQDEHDRQRAIRLLATAWSEANDRERDDLPPVPAPLLSGALVPALRLGARPTDFVEIRLALTDLLTPDLTHYAYRLRPASDDAAPMPAWQPTTRQLVLQGLAAGDYTVEIRAETSTGQPAANVVRIPLRVARVWWMHPAVWALAALALMAAGYGVFWLQGRRARREARLRDELAANLHDDVGGLLTSISLMAEVLQHPEDVADEDHPDEPTAQQLATRLLLNSRAAVQALRDVVWSIDSRADSVQALLDRMEDHLDQTAPAAGLRHSFEADPLPHLQALRPVVRKHLYLVFKEAVTNTLRHAKAATMLHVRLVRDGGFFVLEVTDDGHETSATSRSGIGLRSMADRAKAINGTLIAGPRSDGQPGYQVQLRIKE